MSLEIRFPPHPYFIAQYHPIQTDIFPHWCTPTQTLLYTGVFVYISRQNYCEAAISDTDAACGSLRVQQPEADVARVTIDTKFLLVHAQVSAEVIRLVSSHVDQTQCICKAFGIAELACTTFIDTSCSNLNECVLIELNSLAAMTRTCVFSKNTRCITNFSWRRLSTPLDSVWFKLRHLM